MLLVKSFAYEWLKPFLFPPHLPILLPKITKCGGGGRKKEYAQINSFYKVGLYMDRSGYGVKDSSKQDRNIQKQGKEGCW